VGIDHVHLHVADAERAARFYGEALGAEEAFRAGERLIFLKLPERRGVLVVDARDEGVRNPPHFGLDIGPAGDLDTAVKAVVRAGGRVVERGEHEPGTPYAYLADPDGNVFEL
jgi:catechol 2,3-dioxygenase-like lactoylglutathione lyase family enzyme